MSINRRVALVTGAGRGLGRAYAIALAEQGFWLASGRADALSGCFLSVDDDLDALIARAEEIQRQEQLRLRLRDHSHG